MELGRFESGPRPCAGAGVSWLCVWSAWSTVGLDWGWGWGSRRSESRRVSMSDSRSLIACKVRARSRFSDFKSSCDVLIRCYTCEFEYDPPKLDLIGTFKQECPKITEIISSVKMGAETVPRPPSGNAMRHVGVRSNHIPVVPVRAGNSNSIFSMCPFSCFFCVWLFHFTKVKR